ncbi:MAG: hypothetical protein ACK443_10410, partial [Methylococcaceae bacterium]
MASLNFAGIFIPTASGASNNFYGEETSSCTINTTPLSTSSVTFSQAGTQFSGNNVLGTITYLDSGNNTVTITNALASRPIKVNGDVKGFYVWIDNGTTPGTDDASDTAYIISLDNSYFQTNAAIGSSSDRVDNSLNAVLAIQAGGVAVDSFDVNENSAFAVWTVTATAGQPVSLSLGGTATGGGTDFGATGPTNLQYSLNNGQTWLDYTGAITTPAGGSFLVRTPIVDDAISDNNETVTLTATPTGGTASTGTATIKDDGTGTIFNNDGTPNTTAVPDDDRQMSVSDVTVNEASPYAVFTVSGVAGQLANLSLQDGSGTVGTDTGTGLEYWDGSTWTSYTTAVALPAGGLKVRVEIKNDGTYEGSETFKLVATTTGGVASTGGIGNINDDGTGTIFNPDGTTNNAAVPDDDRQMSVSDVTVNEASPYA